MERLEREASVVPLPLDAADRNIVSTVTGQYTKLFARRTAATRLACKSRAHRHYNLQAARRTIVLGLGTTDKIRTIQQANGRLTEWTRRKSKDE